LVGLILLLLIGSGEPFTWEVPETVEYGETFSLTITCSEPGCTGITTGNINISDGLVFRGGGSSTSVSAVSTPSGRQLSQVIVYQMRFTATGTGRQTIGPLSVALGGIGTYNLDRIAISVGGTASDTGDSPDISSGETRTVWLQGELRDPGGRIYPGTILTLDYYIYASVSVGNVTYWWSAPELGVINHVETIPDSNWEGAGKNGTASRSKLAVVEMMPAAAGSLLAPCFQADVTGTEYDFWGKVQSWTLESAPIVLPVYPFPDNPPERWAGDLLDSVFVAVEQLPSPPGQGGELSFRITCLGPGSIYMQEPPQLSSCLGAQIIPSDQGTAQNKRWWDFILEPEETGCHVIGPDTLIWLDRRNGSYRTATVEPCSLEVSVIPRQDREIELDDLREGMSSREWIFLVGGAAVILTVILGVAARKKDRQLASVVGAEDLDELLTGLENELSVLLSGKREYLGYEELDEFLNRCDTDSLLARRILRFWKDLEGSISDKELSGQTLIKLKKDAGELLEQLKRDLSSNADNEKDNQ